MENFIQVDIYTTSQAIDGLTGALTDYGITGFIIQDSADFESFLEDKDANWDYVDDSLMRLKDVEPHVTVYLHDNSQGFETLAAIRSLIESYSKDNTDGFYGNIRMELANVNEEDWANNWKKYYKPFRVGRSLIIKPSWEDYIPKEGDKILEIDPASTFGTGQHQTTRLVLESLERVIKGGEHVLDLGCGSGILSIASMLLGAKNITMCDIFQNAVQTAMENAQKNNIPAEDCRGFCGNILNDPELRDMLGTGYEIVCANIVADVLIAMAPYFGGFLKKGGYLIVSGIIEERIDEVLFSIYDQGFLQVREVCDEGWCCAVLRYDG